MGHPHSFRFLFIWALFPSLTTVRSLLGRVPPFVSVYHSPKRLRNLRKPSVPGWIACKITLHWSFMLFGMYLFGLYSWGRRYSFPFYWADTSLLKPAGYVNLFAPHSGLFSPSRVPAWGTQKARHVQLNSENKLKSAINYKKVLYILRFYPSNQLKNLGKAPGGDSIGNSPLVSYCTCWPLMPNTHLGWEGLSSRQHNTRVNSAHLGYYSQRRVDLWTWRLRVRHSHARIANYNCSTKAGITNHTAYLSVTRMNWPLFPSRIQAKYISQSKYSVVLNIRFCSPREGEAYSYGLKLRAFKSLRFALLKGTGSRKLLKSFLRELRSTP